MKQQFMSNGINSHLFLWIKIWVWLTQIHCLQPIKSQSWAIIDLFTSQVAKLRTEKPWSWYMPLMYSLQNGLRSLPLFMDHMIILHYLIMHFSVEKILRKHHWNYKKHPEYLTFLLTWVFHLPATSFGTYLNFITLVVMLQDLV